MLRNSSLITSLAQVALRVLKTSSYSKKKISKDNIVKFPSKLTDLEKEIEQTRQDVEPSFLSSYDRVTTIVSRPPYMAPISDQKCSGCHLRVSNDVVSSALVEKKITQCDQCGRIVYIER